MIHKKTTKELVGERPTPNKLKKLPRTPISLVVDNVRSLDNVGMLFRLCELARLNHLYLTGYTGHPRLKKDNRPDNVIKRHEQRITKTAVYAIPHQPWTHAADSLPLIKKLKKQGTQIVSLEQTKTSVSYQEVPITNYKLPIALIIGHERQGIREELLNLSDLIIDIPILGLGNSHNVAMSTGIVLYNILEKTRQI
jgi:tRNA G18 (ribose-2'-O)-methylase SpoU